ncbi:alkaline phosphatase D family protein [Belnapia sp. T6]|uniref:Alkaline phosphatase D family protein n=1 Tax=Belnapia mucosa TaxID=2804532 RepID=A0ABS1UZB2_9PROT|nr:alkaline phosphatase D family protein [Belnapia mucosa]MBL6454802.1 alkaline phosphatase D family protein [Belnapia mucosa]
MPALLLAGTGFGRAADAPFTLGVASGDPWPDSVVIWTRLAPEPLAPLGGMPPGAVVEVGWEVAEDPGFTRIVARGTETAHAAEGFSIHAEPRGLRPGRPYWYRFHAEGVPSPVGRSRTAPAPGTAAPVRFVNAGCQHLEHGWFTAWRHIAEEELEFVFHYGDYIYEFAGRQPGQAGGFGPTIRSHAGGQCRSLEDYRQRYAQYHADPDLAAAHAAHPFIASFDDHEVENNWAGAQSQQDGRSRRHPVALPKAAFLAQRAAAFQAWWEAMPLRRAQRPQGADILAHRRLGFGGLVDLHVLDTRQYRDDQPCGDVNGPACPEVARPEAQMLGAAQEDWLMRGLGASAARWQVLAQQVMLMPRRFANDAISMDKWDAYPAARDRLLRGFAERRIANAVVLSGDVHNAWAGELGWTRRGRWWRASSPPPASAAPGTGRRRCSRPPPPWRATRISASSTTAAAMPCTRRGRTGWRRCSARCRK